MTANPSLALKKAEASILAQLMITPENFYYLQEKVFAGMFRNYKDLAETIFTELESDATRVSLPYLMAKYPGLADQMDSITREADVIPRVGDLVDAIRERFFQGEEIRLHQSSLAKLLEGEPVEKVLAQAQGEREMLSMFSPGRVPKPQQLIEFMERLGGKKTSTGIPTGHRIFDMKTGTMMPGEMWVMGARPGMGKTAFSLEVAINAAQTTGKVAAYFALEMDEDQMLTRLLSYFTGIHQARIRQGKIYPHEWQTIHHVMDSIMDLPVEVICDKYSIPAILSESRRLKMQTGGLSVVVIDYLQLIQAPAGFRPSDRVAIVGEISRSLKLASKKSDLNAPVLALSQLNRKLMDRGDKTPNLADLRESGQIEQDADVIGFIHRPDQYGILEDAEGISLKGITQVVIAKHRHGGELGIYPFRYDESSMKYTEADDMTLGAGQEGGWTEIPAGSVVDGDESHIPF